jgi:DNA helicase-2/ATP-dependent DNA helicase PcrA
MLDSQPALPGLPGLPEPGEPDGTDGPDGQESDAGGVLLDGAQRRAVDAEVGRGAEPLLLDAAQRRAVDAEVERGAEPLLLDAAQRRAVDHGDGPCLVLAGPGSGKTRVIVERFLRLVRAGTPPERLLVLTYTRKAAAEMRDRVERVQGAFEGEPPLLNYHSFAQRVLRRWGWRLGISPAFRIADEAERWLVVDGILGELRPTTLYNPLRAHDLVDSILDLIEKAKQELVSPEAYAAWAAARLDGARPGLERELLTRHRECADVYRRLEAAFLERAVLDHDDTILFAERLLREHEDVREAVAGGIDHVMVDEYQDTNYAQARLVEALAGERGNILVVADDDQSIYKFRGASLANLDRFARIYPQHERVILDRNYRSHEEIVEASRAIIGAAPPGSRIEKHLSADRGAGGTVELWRAADERGEVVEVARECRRLIDGGADPAGIAWLFRRHDDMQAATRALQEEGVAYVVHGGRGFFQRREIKDLLALLGAIHDPGDSQALLRCVNLPSFAVSNAGRLALGQAAHDRDATLAAVIAGELPELSAEDLAAARRLVDAVVELHAQAARDDVREVFYAALERTDFLGALDAAEPSLRAQIGANLNKFGELLEGFADWSDDRSLGLALRYLDILRSSHAADEVADVEQAETGISLLTAHAAKGLEWPVVFLGRCTEERWPGMGGFPARLTLPDELVPEPAPEGEASRDEERRLFYVAATGPGTASSWSTRGATRTPTAMSGRAPSSPPWRGGQTSSAAPSRAPAPPRAASRSRRPACRPRPSAPRCPTSPRSRTAPDATPTAASTGCPSPRHPSAGTAPWSTPCSKPWRRSARPAPRRSPTTRPGCGATPGRRHAAPRAPTASCASSARASSAATPRHRGGGMPRSWTSSSPSP